MKKSYTKDELDRFYTNDDLVDKLLKEVRVSDYRLVVEPSAGAGAFSKKIENCLAFDIAPQHESICKQDFLEYSYQGDVPRKDILCIGNPPYGRQSSLAIKFIKKCTTFADTIAFILPLSFKKISVQNKIPKTYHLNKQLDLDWNSFTLNGNDYRVPCLFQVWKNEYKERKQPELVQPKGYQYVARHEDPDIAVRRVGVYAGKAFLDLDKSIQSHYFIKIDDASPQDIVERLNQHPWEHRNTVGPRSISRPELSAVLNPIVLSN
jgi:hypothetical protein